MRKQRKTMLWAIPCVATIFMIVIQGIYYLGNGRLKVINQIKWSEYQSIQLPSGVSRLWDIIAIFIWTFLLIFLFTNEKIKRDKELIASLIASLFVGFLLGLATVLLVGLFVGLGTGLTTSLVIAPSFTKFNLRAGFIVGLSASMGVGLGFGVVSSFTIGLCISLILFTSFALAFSLIILLIAFVKFLFFK